MNSATHTADGATLAHPDRLFTVEGHGDSQLARFGGVTTAASPYRNSPKLTRAQAWEQAKALARTGQYHTIKVIRGGESVWAMYRTVDGFVDSKMFAPVTL